MVKESILIWTRTHQMVTARSLQLPPSRSMQKIQRDVKMQRKHHKSQRESVVVSEMKTVVMMIFQGRL